MKTSKAIELAGSAKALAELLGVTVSAVSQWKDCLPQARTWQLQTLRPQWFQEEAQPQQSARAA